MRILIQRVSHAAVDVDGDRVGEIGRGYLLLVGISHEDHPGLLEPMARKVVNMRLFPDPDGESHFHRSLLEEKADLLAVSQFTLYANSRKGRRPSFSEAAEPTRAKALFDAFVAELRKLDLRVETGRFGASMEVTLLNQGPVSIWLDSDEVLPGSVSAKRAV
jgi:D-aminoacyl-tRNA deacylase